MRAAFKAVMDGKQVAILAPTTVLAFQHHKTLDRALRRIPRDDRHGQPIPDEGRKRPASWRPPPKASSTSWSARTGCSPRTSGSATWVC